MCIQEFCQQDTCLRFVMQRLVFYHALEAGDAVVALV
jgi:hypothetical protein